MIIMFRDHPDNQQPIILGTIGGIPQKENVIIGKFDNQDVTVTTNGIATDIPTNVTEAQAAEKTSLPLSTISTASTVSDSIPRTPPSSWRGDKIRATAGIVALLEACDKVGLTSREAKSAVLAIAGGECGWIPQEEGYNYSTSSALANTFATTFKKNHPELLEQYTNAAKKGMTREQFFDLVYDPSNNGRAVGNTQPGDGGKFFGRGFIQLTGRPNYTKYGKMAGVDIVTNPSLLNTDISASALVAVTYIKDRTSKSVQMTDNPGFFFAVKTGIGHDTGNGASVRKAFYEYFYGSAVSSDDGVTKDAGPPTATQDTSTTKSSGFIPGPSAGGDIGFKDPNKKYPLTALLNEPDTHRLARGVYKGTVVPIKESQRDIGVPVAFEGEFSQPSIPYGAKYPYNHTYETESGHLQEFDDTPGYERMHRYHRAGTFEEIDSNGTKVTRVIGDNYTIIDRNGSIHIKGECNLTVDGNVNIFVRSDANIEVSGNARMEVGGNYDIGVAGDMTVAVGGTFGVFSQGNASFQTASEANIRSGANTNLFSGADTNISSAGNTNTSAGSTVNINAGGDVNADGARMNLNSGASSPASQAASVPLDIPAGRGALYPNVSYLDSPPLAGEETFSFEDEDQWSTPEGQLAKQEIIKKHGEQTPENTPAQDEAKATGGSTDVAIASCALIFGMEGFAADFRLSPNFTLGMMFDGGFNVRHHLIDQNGLTKQQIVCNLSQLCTNVLEKYLTVLPGGIGGYGKQWKINSAYRQQGGKSDHGYGRAVDIGLLPVGGSTRKQDTFNLVKELEKIVPYDQIILEYRTPGQVWIHTGYRGLTGKETSGGGVNRRMAFTMLNDSTYSQGFILL